MMDSAAPPACVGDCFTLSGFMKGLLYLVGFVLLCVIAIVVYKSVEGSW